ncbi:MAG: carboxymuconolactone decarboxylase family protein [Granulosicoccus sp.]
MSQNYQDRLKDIDKRTGALFKAQTKVMRSFSQLSQAASADGALDAKTKELMSLAISISIRCEDCIVYHLKAAIGHGANEDEIMETLGVAVEMGGGPSVVYSGRALEAYQALSA